MNPLISVIIPVFNGEKYIEAALESVYSQNYGALEIIAVDDGSTDNSADILRRQKKLNYIYQPNSGPASARNTGLNKANGEYIAFIDSDDLWPENKLEQQCAEFKRNTDLEVVMGKIKYEELPGAIGRNTILDSNNSFKSVNLGAGLFKKSAFEKAGYFDENLRFWEDLDWFLRAYESNVIVKYTETTGMIYRIHKSNMSHNKDQCNHFFRKVIKKSLDRRRNFFEDIKYNLLGN